MSGIVSFGLHPGQGGGNTFLGRLVFFGHRNAVAIIPDTDGERHLQHPGGVHRFPKGAFRSGGVADGDEGDLIAVVGEIPPDGRLLAVFFGRESQAQTPRHLAGGGRNIGGDVVAVFMLRPAPILVHQWGGEMAVHLTPPGERVAVGSP